MWRWTENDYSLLFTYGPGNGRTNPPGGEAFSPVGDFCIVWILGSLSDFTSFISGYELHCDIEMSQSKVWKIFWTHPIYSLQYGTISHFKDISDHWLTHPWRLETPWETHSRPHVPFLLVQQSLNLHFPSALTRQKLKFYICLWVLPTLQKSQCCDMSTMRCILQSS